MRSVYTILMRSSDLHSLCQVCRCSCKFLDSRDLCSGSGMVGSPKCSIEGTLASREWEQNILL
jgi:hypothetical protein